MNAAGGGTNSNFCDPEYCSESPTTAESEELTVNKTVPATESGDSQSISVDDSTLAETTVVPNRHVVDSVTNPSPSTVTRVPGIVDGAWFGVIPETKTTFDSICSPLVEMSFEPLQTHECQVNLTAVLTDCSLNLAYLLLLTGVGRY